MVIDAMLLEILFRLMSRLFYSFVDYITGQVYKKIIRYIILKKEDKIDFT